MSKRIYESDLMVMRALAVGPKSLAQLAEWMPISRETIRLALHRLRQRGDVSSSNGVFFNVEKRAAA